MMSRATVACHSAGELSDDPNPTCSSCNVSSSCWSQSLCAMTTISGGDHMVGVDGGLTAWGAKAARIVLEVVWCAKMAVRRLLVRGRSGFC
jgi:hypothetical protein